ncbi:MAG: PaaI family thioesterase [Candidatus Aminicenantes bacterium]|nr:PaaI family thioesterase [Candidatus Aminicenantes bacterium]MCK5004657.1 PaaI family thioesterase [Candidatus Aminicenantes bacterium]
MESVKDDNRCFACGKSNPIGLKLDFEKRGEYTVSLLNFDKNFAGWENMVHGGILSTVLDEVMVKSANNNGFTCVTAELNVRYKKPCHTGMEYELKGKVVDIRKNIIITEGKILNMDGKIIASGSGKLFIINPNRGSIK